MRAGGKSAAVEAMAATQAQMPVSGHDARRPSASELGLASRVPPAATPPRKRGGVALAAVVVGLAVVGAIVFVAMAR